MANLSTYQNETAALLHDQTYSFTSLNQLNLWINNARYSAAERSGCIRRFLTGQSAWGASAQPGSIIAGGMQPGALPNAFPVSSLGNPSVAGGYPNTSVSNLQTIPGVERYPFQGFFNPSLQQAYAGVLGIIDVVMCSVAWGNGASKPALDWMPWEDFQAYCRSINTLVENYPSVWTVYNDGEFGELWMAPTPSQACDIELDVFCVPTDLNTNDDFEAIPQSMSKAIKFGAASLAFMTKGNYAQAQVMEDMFAQALGVARIAMDGGKQPSFYSASRF